MKQEKHLHRKHQSSKLLLLLKHNDTHDDTIKDVGMGRAQ